MFRSVSSSLDTISGAFNTNRLDSHYTLESTPLEKSLDDIAEAIACMRNNSDELVEINDSIDTVATRISNSIDTVSISIGGAIDRHARATKRLAMTASEKSTIDDACVKAIKGVRFHDVKALIQSGANVHYRVPGSERTLFSLACQVGNKAILQFLLKNDATTNDRDATGKTPLDYARASCDKETIKMLTAHGAR